MARRARHSVGDRTPEPEVDAYLALGSHPEPARPAQEAGYEHAMDGDPHRDLAGPDHGVGGKFDVDDELRPERGNEPAARGGDQDLGERGDGPFDATELDMEQTDAVGRLDFGSVRVPMPDEAKLQIESAPGGRLKAVHVLVPLGRLSISALAAPRSEPLWPNLASEIVAALKQDGAWVRWEVGPWAREVVAGTTTAQSRFIGVDGPRWMVYGVATGAAHRIDELTDVLRDMIRGTIVVRDEQPYPVRTVLPLTAPAHLSVQLEKLQTEERSEPEATPPVDQLQPVARQPVARRPVVPLAPAAHPVTPPLGSFPRHLPGQRGAGVPKARHSEHSNPGAAAPLPLQPDSWWARQQRPESADPHESRPSMGLQQPPRGVRRPTRRAADEHGVPTPPSWRAIGDPVHDPLAGWPNDSVHQQPDDLGVVPLTPPLGGDEPPPIGELPAPSRLDDEPRYDEPRYGTPSEYDRRSGRHRLPD